MKLFSKIKKLARKAFAVAAVTTAFAGVSMGVATPTVSAASCDKVNIVYCGINGGSDASDIQNLRSKYNSGKDNGHTDLKAVYGWSGASATDIANMNTGNTKLGTLYKNGDIKVGGDIVATHSYVSARFGAGQNGFSHVEGDVYARLTTTSFAEPSAPVLVHFNANGTEDFSVMINCGNAVKSTPKTPSYTITKTVSVKGANDFHSNITVAPGTHVIYRIVVSSTGSVPVKNVLVKDALPSTAKYVDNTLARDGAKIGDGSFFNSGYTIASLDNGHSSVFSFEAIIGQNDTIANCTDQTIDNVASISGVGLVTKKDNADVNKHCLPKPTYACTNLTATPGSIDPTTGNQGYALTATATATNATVVKYVFTPGDGATLPPVTTSSKTATTTHVYTPGTWTASVTVTFKDAAGNLFTATSANCQKSITVKKLTALTCDSLTANKGAVDPTTGATSYTFTAAATATNATITGYTFNFGDQNDTQTTTSATSKAHVYAASLNGTSYTASVTVNATDIYGKQLTTTVNAHCQATFTATTPVCKPGVPVGSPQCFPSSLTCVNLVPTAGAIDSNGNQSYLFTATANSDNATITSYVFHFGDNTADQTITTAAKTATISPAHSYAPGNYNASVTVHGTDVNGHPITAPNAAACALQVNVNKPNPNITIVKTVDGQKFEQVKVGQHFVYQLVVTNTGKQNLTNAVVTDPAPAGVTMLSTDLGTIVSNSLNYTIPSLAIGQSVTINITGVVATFVEGNLINTACVDAPEVPNPPVTDENHGKDACSTATVTVTPPTPTPPTPPVVTPPTVLVNTGAGSVVGIFAAVSIVATFAYRRFLTRRLSQEG